MKKLLCCFLILFSTLLFACNPSAPPTNDAPKQIFASWWWDDTLDASTYLDFANANGINQIYYCSSKFDQTTMQFINLANQKNIKVFWLDGDYHWLNNPQLMTAKIQKYIAYQKAFPDAQFAGIHFDIEPHQDPNFETYRLELIAKLVNIVHQNSIDYPDIFFGYDIPFWLDDEFGFMGIKKCAYMHIIDYADNVTLMSYRDTAQAIFDTAKDEIEYALENNKTLNLGVETKSSEGDKVSFMEEGKVYMNEQLTLLKQMLPQNFGIVVHQIKTWYELPDVV